MPDDIFRIRRDNTTNWTTQDPTLGLGEIGYDTTLKKLKVGTGSTAWTVLDFVTAGITNGTYGDIVVSGGGSIWNLSSALMTTINSKLNSGPLNGGTPASAVQVMQLRRGTAWTGVVLNAGEMGYDTAANEIRVGDGSTVWAVLNPIGLPKINSFTLNDLGDVTIVSPAVGQVVTWNGSAFVNQSIPAPSLGLNNLTDVVLSAPTNTQVLQFNGTRWVNANAGGTGPLSDGTKGDIQVSGSGSTWTVRPTTITYSKMQNVSADKILGSAAGGVVSEIDCTAAGRALLDDASAADQRTTLGAAATVHTHATGDITSGTFDIARIPTGTTSATVCVGNDSRLSDARTPTAHTHAISDVTNLQTSLDNKVDDSQISAFGLTLIDDADSATARTTLGLGTIATQAANNIAVTGGTLQGVTVTTGTYSSPVNQGLLYAVRKSTAGTITKGRPVYIVGSTGNHLTVELARADTEATSAYTIGVAATDITNGADGFIMLKGRLTGLDNLPTSTFADGDPIYLDETTAGGLRKTLPAAPNHGVFLGFVVKANNGSAGELDVHIQNYQELEELSDVNISGIAANHFLKRNAANTRWENVSPADARTGLGLGTLATQSGTFSGSSSGTNTGDQNTFTTIAVSGQSNVVADSTSDTLTLIAGTNVTLTTDPTNDTITINASGGGGGVDEDFVIAMAITLG